MGQQRPHQHSPLLLMVATMTTRYAKYREADLCAVSTVRERKLGTTGAKQLLFALGRRRMFT